MAYSAGLSAYASAFAVSPITLTGGIASDIFGSMLPLMSVIESLGLTDAPSFGADSAFATFQPLPNTSLIDNQIGKYPFANLAIAANAIIRQPLVVSMLMICPVKDPGGYWSKLGIMTSLQNTLQNHCSQGGTFAVATPSFFFSDVILTGVHDVSSGESKQAQIMWRWDFEKPLVSLADAAAVQSQMMSDISSGLPTDGSQSGPDAVGPQAAAAPAASPAAAATPSASIPSYSNPSASYQMPGGNSYIGSSPFSI